VKSETGLHNVRKYDYIPNGVWILEELIYNDGNPEIDKQSYEPKWVFISPGGKIQEPNLKACILVVESSRRGPETVMSEDEEREKAENEAFEILGGNAGISDKLDAGEGVVVPSTYKENK
jgi:hypothetical protein